MLDGTACVDGGDRGLKAYPHLLGLIIAGQQRKSVDRRPSTQARQHPIELGQAGFGVAQKALPGTIKCAQSWLNNGVAC